MTEHAARIYHIAFSADLTARKSDDDYQCASLETEGFIHCCNRQQLPGVVNRYYAGIDDVQLMIIDVDNLEARLVLENTVGGDELFPHVYGPINASSIIDLMPFGVDSLERTGLYE